MYKATILVIDDEQRFLDIITNTLKASDYKVIQALNGEMGVMVARKFIPDIIICDWEMPILNGIDAIKILKQDDVTKDIPIIMATGAMTSPKNLNTALTAGAVDYIRKPIDPIELVARLNSALKLAASYAEIKQKNKELHLLNATKDKFFSIIAHDLKSPFNSILGFTNLLAVSYHKFSDDKRISFINMLDSAVKGTFSLLENLLTWAQLQRDQITIEKKNINLMQLVNESINPYLPSARIKEIIILNNITPEQMVLADKYTIGTTIGNLINNAIKFTPKGGKIEISAKKTKKSIEVIIKDTGVGISLDKIDDLFSIEINNSTLGTNGEKGTGLGVILCKEFVEKNGGSIVVKSEMNKGSEFIISLLQKSE